MSKYITYINLTGRLLKKYEILDKDDDEVN